MKSSKKLSEIQNELHSSIKTGTNSAAICNIVCEKPPVGIRERLSIYQTAYQLRMVESLRDDFSSVSDHLGDAFDALALKFLSENPSKYQNLAEVSQHFPDFIKVHANEMFIFALRDWMEIQSTIAAEPRESELANADDIIKGISFSLRKHPATQVVDKGDSSFLSYRHKDDIEFLNIKAPASELLKFLTVGKSQQEVLLWAQQNKLSEQTLGEYLTKWIQLNIIYCERTTEI